MKKPILGCDAHKRYSVFVRLHEDGKTDPPQRVEHQREAFVDFLQNLADPTDIAIESTGHWYWLVDEMQKAGHHPHLAQPHTAKQMMRGTNKTDALDAKGLAILLRNGTLPEVWIPPRDLRDQREILRTRMALRDHRTMLKHRIHSALERYGIFHTGISDLFGKAGREFLAGDTLRQHLPPHTAAMVAEQLLALDELDAHVEKLEALIRKTIAPDPVVKRLQTAPGIGEILGPVIALEIGDISRFARAEQLASYAGLVPRVFSSGGKTTLGRTSRFVNLYLKWAFVEAAVCATHIRGPLYQHVRDLYSRLQPSKGHGRAAVACARHLAEAVFWMLTKQEDYRPPQRVRPSSPASEAAKAPSSPKPKKKASRTSSTNGSARDTSDN
jgi:transposase